jgi:hypothetical protein
MLAKWHACMLGAIMHACQVETMHSPLNNIYGLLSQCMNHSASTPVFGALYAKSLGNIYLVFLFLFGFVLVIFVSSESIIVDELRPWQSCTYSFICICIHTLIFIFISNIHANSSIYTCIFTYIWIDRCIFAYICIHTCIFTYKEAHLPIHEYIHEYSCVLYLYVWFIFTCLPHVSCIFVACLLCVCRIVAAYLMLHVCCMFVAYFLHSNCMFAASLPHNSSMFDA